MQTAGPEAIPMAFAIENFGTWAGEKTGMPAELIRSETDKQNIIQAGAEAEQSGLTQAPRPIQ
jgi:hypothetical protein